MVLIWNNLELPDNPYYQDDAVIIYHADCREILPLIPDKSIDLVYADPPFNTQDGMGPQNRNYNDRKLSNDRLSEIEYANWCADWLFEVKRITENILITPGIKNMTLYNDYRWCVCISKPSAPSYSVFGGFNCWEPVLCWGKPEKRLSRDMVVFDSQNLRRGIESKHPCPDNEAMVDWLIDWYSSIDNLILDPFLGSGTACYCAKKLNRKCIGIEIEEKYCEIAANRCRQTVMELNV